jgi:hypothetical protein
MPPVNEAGSIQSSSESIVVEDDEVLSSIHTDDSPRCVDVKIKTGSKFPKKVKGKNNKKKATPNKKRLPTAKTMITRMHVDRPLSCSHFGTRAQSGAKSFRYY